MIFGTTGWKQFGALNNLTTLSGSSGFEEERGEMYGHATGPVSKRVKQKLFSLVKDFRVKKATKKNQKKIDTYPKNAGNL